MRPIRSLLFLLIAAPLATLVVAPVGAQAAFVADATVRSAPGGSVIAVLKQGTTVTVGAARGSEVYVTFTGWIDGSKLGGARDSFPIQLTGNIAMRLRSAPSMQGAILGEVRPGAGLHELGKRASWSNVRRGGWVQARTLPRDAAKPVAAARPAAPPAKAPGRAPTPAPKQAAPAQEQAGAPPDSTAVIEPIPDGALRVAKVTAMRSAPNGIVRGQLAAGTVVTPLARSRGWVRVRAEVWVPEKDLVPTDPSFGATYSAADLRADPEGTRGKTVRWEVQVLALQRADPLRRDLAQDEPYFLAKGPGSEDALIYLAIPPSLLGEARSVQALARILVTARVRTGRSQPVGIPILDILSFSKQ